jgi:protein-tyrosine phosphatase
MLQAQDPVIPGAVEVRTGVFILRAFLMDLPKGAKVLLHCSDGNRAAAVICPWLVLDKGMPIEEAMRIAKTAGLQFPETEEAVRRYIWSRRRV